LCRFNNLGFEIIGLFERESSNNPKGKKEIKDEFLIMIAAKAAFWQSDSLHRGRMPADDGQSIYSQS
jgi:hypothetical protein